MRSVLPLLLMMTAHGALVAAAEAPQTQPSRRLTLDLDKAVALSLPKVARDLVPQTFRTPDGREGWICLLYTSPSPRDS